MARPGQVLGGFRIERSLGRGGFGEVYLAEDDSGRLAAVKVLHASWAGDTDMRRRFATEVDQARRVSGFCIASILDADPDADEPWIATEYIDGPTLQTAVDVEGPRTEADLHRLAVSTATALAAIHSAGVVHRDLKPENIMLAADGPRVIDFGIARAVESTSVTASGVIGTIGYMAPEQLEGMRLTSAVDLFSWGAVMVFAATGREAFPGPTQASRIARVLSGQADLDGIPESLAPAVRACLTSAPEARPDARTLLDHLVTGTVLAPQAPADSAPQSGPTLVEGVDDGATRQQDPARAHSPYAEAASGSGPEQHAPSGAQTPASSGTGGQAPPYYFAGRRLRTVQELAPALQENWTDAVRVMSDAQERATLGAWIIDDLNDTLVDRSLFRRKVTDANAAVATLIAQARPDLPPVFRGHDCSITGLSRLFEDPRPLLSGDPRSNELGLLARPEVLRIMSQHEVSDAGALRSLAEDLVEAERIGARFHQQLAQGLSGWRGTQNHVDPAVILVFLLHPELVRRPDPGARPGVSEWIEILWARVERSEGPRAPDTPPRSTGHWRP